MTSVTYTVEITHDDDGELTVSVSGVGDSEEDRKSVAWALREAAAITERGEPIRKENFC
jgi:hypothetical protein